MWLRLGFCSGAVFLLTAQAYYHYFVPIVPFAALLAAPVVRPWFDRSRRLLIASAVVASLLWALDVEFGPPEARLFVSASSLPSAQQTAAVIDQRTPARSRILTDEFEYALLAHRSLAQDYFWNMQNSVSARTLERQLEDTAAVVETSGIGPSYPRGFADYLEDRHFPHVRTGSATIWLISGRSTG
jgi:hypothetical protein